MDFDVGLLIFGSFVHNISHKQFKIARISYRMVVGTLQTIASNEQWLLKLKYDPAFSSTGCAPLVSIPFVVIKQFPRPFSFGGSAISKIVMCCNLGGIMIKLYL